MVPARIKKPPGEGLRLHSLVAIHMRKSSAGWRGLVGLSLVSGLLFAGPRALADDAKPGLAAEATITPQRFTLANGLTVLLDPDPTATRVTLRVVWDLGAKDDPEDMRGMSEVVEGLLADPSTRHVRREMRQSLLRALGIEEWKTDVRAAFDHTAVQVTVPPSDVSLALWLESDRMGFLLDGTDDPVISEKATSAEPSGWDSAATFRLGRAALFGKHHPYGGEMDLSGFTPKAVREHLRKHLVPRNTVVALSGSFDPKVVKAQIEEDFGSLADLPKPKGPVVPEAAVTKEKRVRGEASVALPRVAMLWATPAFLDPEDASFDGIANILDERLTKKYVEGSKVATSVDVHQASMKLASVMEARITAAPGHSEAEMETLLDDEIEKMRTEGPTADEVRRISRTYVLNKSLDFTRTTNRAYVMSVTFLIAGDAAYAPKWFGAYEALTPAKIKSAAEKYLGKSKRVVVTITPNPRAPTFGRAIVGGGL